MESSLTHLLALNISAYNSHGMISISMLVEQVHTTKLLGLKYISTTISSSSKMGKLWRLKTVDMEQLSASETTFH